MGAGLFFTLVRCCWLLVKQLRCSMMGLAWSTLEGEPLSDFSVLYPSISFWAKKLLPAVFVTVVEAIMWTYNEKWSTYFAVLSYRQLAKLRITAVDRKVGMPYIYISQKQHLLDRLGLSWTLDSDDLGLWKLGGVVLALYVVLNELLKLWHSVLLMTVLSRRLGIALKSLLLVNLFYLKVFLS